jgi:hypothetical protein
MLFHTARDHLSCHYRKMTPYLLKPIDSIFWHIRPFVRQMALNHITNQNNILENPLSKVIVTFRIFLHQYQIVCALYYLQFQEREELEQFRFHHQRERGFDVVRVHFS